MIDKEKKFSCLRGMSFTIEDIEWVINFMFKRLWTNSKE